ncbi:lipopolysaccharide assembly protein LapA domain-containing protein [Sphingomonas bacterium]|uniref:lipopolysaccharide assembly protein LapA domain-containing protein n=1 Tax=Sphingomonas bacterium TaxID=1895847 RepID=UPI001576897F|nr:lipopolysaccharide assembly protein LapA domain-containing protein [Sphingomonas bacterium]
MQFLKILFWCLLTFLAAIFTYGNWDLVEIHLWSGLIADVNLPLLLLVTFLAGFLPMLVFHHAVRWRLRQRLAACERALADLRIVPPAPQPPVSPLPVVASETPPTPIVSVQAIDP